MGEMGARAKTIKMIFFNNVEGKGKGKGKGKNIKGKGKNIKGKGKGKYINDTS